MNITERLKLGRDQKLNAVLQTEASECGLACLAMVANFYDRATELGGLRHRYGISMKGATLAEIVQIADQIGFATRPLRLELDELAMLQVPCILHWDLNHFVVLAGFKNQDVIICDPAVGRRVLSFAEVSKHFTGVALELTPTTQFETAKPQPKVQASQLLGNLKGIKPALMQMLGLALAIEVFAMVSPMFMGWVVDQVLVSGDQDLLLTLALGFGLLLLLQTTVSSMRGWMLMGLNASMKVQSRANLFSHLINLPTSFFDARHLGDVMSRFGSQEVILQAITSELIEAVLDGLLSVITLIIMVIFAPLLTLIAVVGAVLYALLRWASYTPLRQASIEAIVWGARRDTHFLETLRGVRTIKLFNGQVERRARWLNLLVETINRQLRADKLRLAFRTASGLLLGILKITIVWLGARQVLNGGFSVGLLLAFIAYKDQFLDRVTELVNKLVDLTMLRLHAERLADVALAEPETKGTWITSDTEYLPGSIEVRNVSFRYHPNEPWILNKVNFQINAWESVAIVGPSGGGKTTLLKILCGLLKPTEGEILINGEPMSKIGLEKYRAMLGVVMQDDQLFAGSISDNICFFAEKPDAKRIASCASAAAVFDDIAAMPMGFDTLIGDMGTILSGGQKQRVLIARALYRRPAVLLLDEATSHLDVDREKSVNDALRKVRMTRIIIAHRPETIRASDRVLVLRDGQISRGNLSAPIGSFG